MFLHGLWKCFVFCLIGFSFRFFNESYKILRFSWSDRFFLLVLNFNQKELINLKLTLWKKNWIFAKSILNTGYSICVFFFLCDENWNNNISRISNNNKFKRKNDKSEVFLYPVIRESCKYQVDGASDRKREEKKDENYAEHLYWTRHDRIIRKFFRMQ